MATTLKTIVIAEDEPIVMRLLLAIATQSGYQCLVTATTGDDLIDLVRRQKPNVVLTDFHMPGRDGLEMIRQLTALKTSAVVVLTAETDPVIARQALEAGASGYLHKPSNEVQIVAALESAWHGFNTVTALEEKARALDEALELRKLTEKAKGILMSQQGMNEDAAHKTVLRMAQDQGITLKEVCRSIIQVRMLLGNSKTRAPGSI
jgi:AmiR/NasT family two-component response regulator